MRVRQFEAELWLPQPRDELFAFFSNAANLEAITPPCLHFRTVSPRPIEMHPGAGSSQTSGGAATTSTTRAERLYSSRPRCARRLKGVPGEWHLFSRAKE
jgi:hypothetical protein